MWFIAFCGGTYLMTIFQMCSQYFENPVNWVCFTIAVGIGVIFAISAVYVEVLAFVGCGIVIGRTTCGFLLILCYNLGNYKGYDMFEGYFTLATMIAMICFSLWFRHNEFYHVILLATSLSGIITRSVIYATFMINVTWNNTVLRVTLTLLTL